jgi:hypothetical protein
MNSITDSHLQPNETADFARSTLHTVPVAARAGLVNRTHRVVRERAKMMQEKRNRERSLMVPLTVCAVLLILSALAVWTGLYQYQAAETVEAVQSDVAALADTNNHFLVVLLWFVPVSAALLLTVWVRRSRNNSDDEVR